MERTKELQGKGRLLLGAMALALVVFLGLFAQAFSTVSYAASQGKVTAANGAKVRKEATSSSEMVGSAALNKEVTINSSVQGSDGYTWYQVTVDGVNGYIRSDLVQTTDGGAAANTNETPAEVTAVNPVSATVTGGQSVRIRSNASTTSQIVTTAASGLALTVTGQATGSDGKIWYQVNFISDGSSVEGFIREDYVNLSGEVTPYTEEPEEPEDTAEPENQPEETDGTEELKAYETVQKDGKWYLVITETNEGYVIQEIFDNMASNIAEYEKLEKKAKTEKIVIIILVIFLVAAASGVALLFFKMKDMADAQYFSQVEKETLRKREPARQGGQKVMHTVGAEKQGAARPAGARPAGAAQGQRSAGAAQGQRSAGASQGQRPAGAVQGQRSAGAAQGQRPAGATQGQRPAAAAQGQRSAGATQGQRPAGASQGQKAAGAAKSQRPAAQQGRPAREAQKPQSRQGNAQPGWQSKNFMTDDDDEFEFEFLNYDGEDEQ